MQEEPKQQYRCRLSAVTCPTRCARRLHLDTIFEEIPSGTRDCRRASVVAAGECGLPPSPKAESHVSPWPPSSLWSPPVNESATRGHLAVRDSNRKTVRHVSQTFSSISQLVVVSVWCSSAAQASGNSRVGSVCHASFPISNNIPAFYQKPPNCRTSSREMIRWSRVYMSFNSKEIGFVALLRISCHVALLFWLLI